MTTTGEKSCSCKDGNKTSHPGPGGSLGFGVCPFSLAVFAATVLTYTWHLQQKNEKKKNSSGDNDVVLPSCQVVFVLGGPGAGKGTQCELITKRLKGWAHLSAGDLLRAERQRAGSKLGDQINECIAAGKLVPSEITCKLLENAMKASFATSGCTKFLVDGYPRSQGNVDAWEKTMQGQQVQFVLFFECPEDVLVKRLLDRGQTSGRNDDNIETIKKRFHTYQEETDPIVRAYEASGKVKKIFSDKSVEEVYAEVEALLKHL